MPLESRVGFVFSMISPDLKPLLYITDFTIVLWINLKGGT